MNVGVVISHTSVHFSDSTVISMFFTIIPHPHFCLKALETWLFSEFVQANLHYLCKCMFAC